MGTIARLTMTVRDRAFIQQNQKDRARVRTRFYRSEDQFINAEIYLENHQEYPYNDPDGVRRIMNSNLGKNK